ncbi:aminopeptidase N [Escherichia coli]|uniref:Aminopeptidase N n=1 Tax=Escherichia coli TaxID=562 RepID=A0A377CXW8_ECOLX|nr:aminopeptidase N [Escherichia coli]
MAGPVPENRATCLRLVAGDFDVLRDTFTTRSGREVALELYVDRGNLNRAPWAMTSLEKLHEMG